MNNNNEKAPVGKKSSSDDDDGKKRPAFDSTSNRVETSSKAVRGRGGDRGDFQSNETDNDDNDDEVAAQAQSQLEVDATNPALPSLLKDVEDPLGLLSSSSLVASAAASSASHIADCEERARIRRGPPRTDQERREKRLAANRKSARNARLRSLIHVEELQKIERTTRETNQRLVWENGELDKLLSYAKARLSEQGIEMPATSDDHGSEQSQSAVTNPSQSELTSSTLSQSNSLSSPQPSSASQEAGAESAGQEVSSTSRRTQTIPQPSLPPPQQAQQATGDNETCPEETPNNPRRRDESEAASTNNLDLQAAMRLLQAQQAAQAGQQAQLEFLQLRQLQQQLRSSASPPVPIAAVAPQGGPQYIQQLMPAYYPQVTFVPNDNPLLQGSTFVPVATATNLNSFLLTNSLNNANITAAFQTQAAAHNNLQQPQQWPQGQQGAGVTMQPIYLMQTQLATTATTNHHPPPQQQDDTVASLPFVNAEGSALLAANAAAYGQQRGDVSATSTEVNTEERPHALSSVHNEIAGAFMAPNQGPVSMPSSSTEMQLAQNAVQTDEGIGWNSSHSTSVLDATPSSSAQQVQREPHHNGGIEEAANVTPGGLVERTGEQNEGRPRQHLTTSGNALPDSQKSSS